MFEISQIPGLEELWSKTQGDPEIRVAVLDGPVDQKHPCFEGANLSFLKTLVQDEAKSAGRMSLHGTHVSSLIFGQPDSPLPGIAPQCQGLLTPIFSDEPRPLSQLDLSRAIEQAVMAGAHVINISAGQLTDFGEAEDWLDRAVRLCRENDVLIVAAAGNDGCECLHVPAALPFVLAAGAMDEEGQPMDMSNWGEAYQTQGILAPGKDILGAQPGGETVALTGTSFAAPIVTGVVALLLSLQKQQGKEISPQHVLKALLKTASPCEGLPSEEGNRCLMGKLNVTDALHYLTGDTMSEQMDTIDASCSCEETDIESQESTSSMEVTRPSQAVMPSEAPATPATPAPPAAPAPTVTPSQVAPSNGGELAYAIGTLGYDFGTEARRDSFKQLMDPLDFNGTTVPANPYDARQMADHLGKSLYEAKSLIWTLNLELTPIYAIEPGGPFSHDVYQVLQQLLAGQVLAEDAEDYIERVSLPARLTGRTVKLFSGQVVPVIAPDSARGLYGWKVNTLVESAMKAVKSQKQDADDDNMRKSLTTFLNRIYYDLRNLGQTSQDRALNFAATNAFQAAESFSEAASVGMELDNITVLRSPFARMDSDCWDVQLKFFDPENSRRARKVFRFTIDVSDLMPVTMGEVRSWSTPM